MKKTRTIWLSWLLLILFAGYTEHPKRSLHAASRPQDKSAWKLIWYDEFNGPNGARPDASKWSYDTGGWGWGNNELEYYTDRAQNSFIEKGNLAIRAALETYTGKDKVTRNYTSARLLTKNKFALTYGKAEARIKITYGQGLWPAFWMLGDNIESVKWPDCGEIDIMENIGREPSAVHGTVHGPGYSGGEGIGATYELPEGKRFADDFHTFAVEWEPNVIRHYVDGHLYQTLTPANLPKGRAWVFDHPFFLLLNVAVGGNWPGDPDPGTAFPQTMRVDYVRVYQRAKP
jgi:beta-glucanase (GH16 family)